MMDLFWLYIQNDNKINMLSDKLIRSRPTSLQNDIYEETNLLLREEHTPGAILSTWE
jgi:hypothetical protein